MKITILVFLVVSSFVLTGCGLDNKVNSSTNDDEIVSEEFQDPFAKEEVKLRTTIEVKSDYSANRKSIVAKKQINFLDKDKVDKNLVLEYAKNSVIIANTSENKKASKKKDIVEKLVLLDDLQHNTTNDINTEVTIYILELWQKGRFEEALTLDEQLELLYLTKYLDIALDNNPIFDAADEIIHNMCLLIQDKIQGKSRKIEDYKKNIDPMIESVMGQLKNL
ncbi:MAG: hypothetical protein ACRDCW_11010 [Sarcina sp.]